MWEMAWCYELSPRYQLIFCWCILTYCQSIHRRSTRDAVIQRNTSRMPTLPWEWETGVWLAEEECCHQRLRAARQDLDASKKSWSCEQSVCPSVCLYFSCPSTVHTVNIEPLVTLQWPCSKGWSTLGIFWSVRCGRRFAVRPAVSDVYSPKKTDRKNLESQSAIFLEFYAVLMQPYLNVKDYVFSGN